MLAATDRTDASLTVVIRRGVDTITPLSLGAE
jgi:hypothetical protein